jgi:phospholipase C
MWGARRHRGSARPRVLLGGAAVALVAISCSGSDRAAAPAPSSVATKWPIKHVVFIVKENRSFDNLFGTFPGADGATTGMDGARKVRLKRASYVIPTDVPHAYSDAVADWNGGEMNGFGHKVPGMDSSYAYTQFTASQIPNYWRWAKDFVLGDNFYASVMGSSFPNRLFTIAADSAGTRDGPNARVPRPHGHAKSWGCDAPKGETVGVIDPEGGTVHEPPCFDIQTEGDLLTEAGVGWASYTATQTQNGYIWSAYNSIEHIRNSEAWSQHVFPVDDLTTDIAANKLPSVTWVAPRFEDSDHPKFKTSLCEGENWTTQVVNAIMKSDMWKDTAIFVSWDEWGGFYDHVAPQQVDRFGLGFRVPLLAISPYALRGHIDHHWGEFSSVLRFIEDNWGLSNLTKRDANAGDLSYDFSFTQRPLAPDPLPSIQGCPASGHSPMP